MSLVRKPHQGRQRAIEVVGPKDVERIRARMAAEADLLSKTLTVVLADSGLWPAEALGLELRHVRGDTLLIEQAVSHGKLKLQKTGRVYRTVDLLSALRDDLRERIAARGITDARELLFPAHVGKPDAGHHRARELLVAPQIPGATRRAGQRGPLAWHGEDYIMKTYRIDANGTGR